MRSPFVTPLQRHQCITSININLHNMGEAVKSTSTEEADDLPGEAPPLRKRPARDPIQLGTLTAPAADGQPLAHSDITGAFQRLLELCLLFRRLPLFSLFFNLARERRFRSLVYTVSSI